ncbi:molybdopterin converting factor subunit 1 [Paenibacillus caui]|uniref:molybdopterin converting factor subunit 1 n=1 Tax=Paenibacillus caui TaxID=2873927 RepID=UPI001CA8C31A|nr:molybdopterin converting factor subunit 1 [Paenibacillus caui]
MKLRIRLFAGLAESLKSSSVDLDTEGSSLTAADLKALLTERYPEASGQIAQSFVAVNQEYAPDDTPIQPGDEVALIPPVSGGEHSLAEDVTTEEGLFAITSMPLDVEEIESKVIHPNHGASLVFVGTTREMTGAKRTIHLEYEAYTPMALKTLQQIGEEIEKKWPGTITAISHRIGKVNIAEASVVIAVSAPHRDACYEASRYAIERLKLIVPIWKKEIWEDGSEWKGPQSHTWDPTVTKN